MKGGRRKKEIKKKYASSREIVSVTRQINQQKSKGETPIRSYTR